MEIYAPSVRATKLMKIMQIVANCILIALLVSIDLYVRGSRDNFVVIRSKLILLGFITRSFRLVYSIGKILIGFFGGK